MGRSTPNTGIENHIRTLREARRLSQSQLAAGCGLTRQAISAIESGAYVPNTGVSLRLAAALQCRVEDLFALPASPAAGPVHFAVPPSGTGQRFAAAYVRGRLVGYGLGRDRAIHEGFVAPDGLFGPGASAAVLTSGARLERTAILLGCDPSLAIAASLLGSPGRDLRVLWFPTPSADALAALSAGEAHIAGTHIAHGDGADFNLPEASLALGVTGGIVVTFAAWEQGFVVAPGNPKGLRTVEDLARPDVWLANRERSAGIRAFIDQLLERAGIPPAAVRGYENEVAGHFAAARAVALGLADAGLGLRAVADTFGLDFVPLGHARFDLVVPRDHRDHVAVAALLELINHSSFRAALGALPGYDVSETGKVVSEVAPTEAA